MFSSSNEININDNKIDRDKRSKARKKKHRLRMTKFKNLVWPKNHNFSF